VIGLRIMGISIDQLNTDLFGESKFDLLASGGSQLGVAFLNRFSGIFNLGNSDGSFFSKIFTRYTGKGDGFVDAGLDGFGIGYINWDIDGSDNGYVVSGGLGNFLAVVVSVRSVSISMVSGLADSDHLYVFFLFEGNFDSLGSGGFYFGLVRVGADFVIDFFDRFCAHGTGDGVGEFFVNNNFDGQVNISTDGFESGGAHFGDFSHILDSAVMFGFFITVSVMTVSGGVVTISGGSMVTISGGGGVVGGGLVVGAVRRGGVGWAAGHEGEECQDSECLHDVMLVV